MASNSASVMDCPKHFWMGMGMQPCPQCFPARSDPHPQLKGTAMHVGDRVRYTGTMSPKLVGREGDVVKVALETGEASVRFDDGSQIGVYADNLTLVSRANAPHGVPPYAKEVPLPPDINDPMKVQVGGSHYTKCKIQPMEYSMANGLDALQHTIVKYVTRFRDKNGIEDLKKARHAVDMLIAHEEKNAIR